MILVAHVEHARAADLGGVQRGIHLERRMRSAIVAQSPVECAPLLRVDRGRVLRSIRRGCTPRGGEPEEFRHPIVDCAAERADIDPAITAFERIVELEARRPIAGMPGDRALAGEDRQCIAIVWATASYCARSTTCPRPLFLTSHSAIIVAVHPVSAVT